MSLCTFFLSNQQTLDPSGHWEAKLNPHPTVSSHWRRHVNQSSRWHQWHHISLSLQSANLELSKKVFNLKMLSQMRTVHFCQLQKEPRKGKADDGTQWGRFSNNQWFTYHPLRVSWGRDVHFQNRCWVQTPDRSICHHQQGRIDFTTVNPSLSTGKDFLIHSL